MNILLRSSIVIVALLAFGCGSRDSSNTTNDPAPASGAEQNGQPTGEPAPQGDLALGTDACASDADCAPADCCHPAACVARGSAPSCVDVMCTQDCRSGTMDCGGGCLCHEGRCAARLVDLAASAQ